MSRASRRCQSLVVLTIFVGAACTTQTAELPPDGVEVPGSITTLPMNTSTPELGKDGACCVTPAPTPPPAVNGHRVF